MIADQQTGKNCGQALADYRNGASAVPLLCIFWPIFKNISDQRLQTTKMELSLICCSALFLPIFKNVSMRRNYQIMGVDTDNDTDSAEQRTTACCELQ
jgi:hypothetical protein